jgi:dihydrofolate synthase/folylpolyglutamate synthase
MRFVHIAGTNGKGSVAEYISHILTAAGKRCGCFTSPHLVSPTERLRIDGQEIDQDALDVLMAEVSRKGLAVNSTLFAAYTAAALLWFKRENAAWAVMETGLGGRLDPTNVISPAVTVLTSVDVDHTDVLGQRIEDIAFEKAGIIKPGVPVVSALQRPEVHDIFEARCHDVGATLQYADDADVLSASLGGQTFSFQGGRYTIRAIGKAQPGNAALAVLACRTLGISEKAIADGLMHTTLPARIQYIKGEPHMIIDGAHNPAAAVLLAETLSQYFSNTKKVFLLACMSNKDWRGVLDALQSHMDYAIITQADAVRGADPKELCAYLSAQTACQTQYDPALAFKNAKAAAKDSGALLVVTGSLYLAGIVQRQFI